MKYKTKFNPVEFLLDHIATLVFAVLVLGLYVYTMGHSMIGFGGSFTMTLINRVGAYLPMALGAGLILMVSGVDLSAGRVMGFSALISAALLQSTEAMSRVFPDMQPMPVATVFIIAIIFGVIFSTVNGALVSTLKAPSFAVTLGMQFVLYGGILAFLAMGTNAGQSIFPLIEKYTDVVTGGVIPKYVLVSFGIALAMCIVLIFTPVGRMMRAVGTDREAAKKNGINPMLMTLIAFIVAGALYGYNGFVEAARIGGPGASSGVNKEIDALIACLIGGMSVKGGKGGIGGVIIGVIFIQLVEICLQWLAIDPNYVYIIKGGMVILAIVLDMVRWMLVKVEK